MLTNKKRHQIWVAIILLWFLPCNALSQSAVGRGTTTTITINASRPARYKIPRTIYGTFLEPIGNSIYGGLWADALENPSFEENLWSAERLRQKILREPSLLRASQLGLPLPWEPLDSSQGARYEPRWNDAANSSRSLMIMALPGKQTGVKQEVYLPVHRILRYTGSLYAKHLSGPATIEVSLRARNHPERVLARREIITKGNDWSRYDFALELSAGQLDPLEPADFVIALADEGRALVDQAALLPADHLDGLDPEEVALARDLKTPLVRFGGNFTSAYHWRDGTGARDKRVSMLNVSWGIPEYNQFGTDEFLRFCELIGAKPQIALNLGSGTPEEAADWVRYVNGKWADKSGGLLWELGNELWGDFQVGYPTLARIAPRTRAYSEAIKRVDPKAQLIATGADPDHFEQWNASQLNDPTATFNYLSTHFVVTVNELRTRNSSPEFSALAAFALPVELERRLRSMKAQVVAAPPERADVKFAFTEWLYYGGDERYPQFRNLGGAICTAGMLNTLMRVADIVPISDMTGLMEFGGIWKKRGRVYGVPAYWAFRMYANADATRPVEINTDGENYNVTAGITRLPDISDVPYLDVVAALNDAGDRLTLFCLNRHLTRDIRANIKINGFSPANVGVAKTLTSPSIYDINDEAQPENVIPLERRINTATPDFAYTFGKSSVTVIELRKDQGK